MEFPSNWDMANDKAHRLYKKCKKYYKVDEEDKFIDVFNLHPIVHVYCLGVIIYNFISIIIIILKKKSYLKVNISFTLSLLFSIGSFLTVSLYYIKKMFYFDFPCYIIPYICAVAIPMSIFSCGGMILFYLKHCYINASLYNKHYNEDKYKNYNRGFLRKISLAFSEKMVIKIILLSITLNIFYVNVLSTFNVSYTINPLLKGFCVVIYEQLPVYTLLTLFLVIFLPMAIHDISMFRANFSFGRGLLISLIFNLLFVIIYIITIFLSSYKCTKISKYIPSEIYFITLYLIFHIAHISMPMIEVFKINQHIIGLELNKKGLIRIFDDELLYKQFFEYAVKKRSVEYALFHVEYMEFKELFKANNTKVVDDSSQVFSPTVGNKDRKFIQQYETIYNKATDIFEKYFKENSELELNLPGKLIRSITDKYYEYTIYYNRNIVNTDDEHEIDLKKLNCETLYDEVHEEVIDSLFLNVYSSFAKDQKKTIKEKSNK